MSVGGYIQKMSNIHSCEINNPIFLLKCKRWKCEERRGEGIKILAQFDVLEDRFFYCSPDTIRSSLENGIVPAKKKKNMWGANSSPSYFLKRLFIKKYTMINIYGERTALYQS